MSGEWNSYLDMGNSQLQCDPVCRRCTRTWRYYASRYFCSIRFVHCAAEMVHVFTNKQNKLAFLSERSNFTILVDFSLCSKHIFPSPENQHCAQTTDKYLIGLPSVPFPLPWQQLAVGRRICMPCHSLGTKAHVGDTFCPCSPVDTFPAGAGTVCFPVWARSQGGTDE